MEKMFEQSDHEPMSPGRTASPDGHANTVHPIR
jgi:hypothetical protein